MPNNQTRRLAHGAMMIALFTIFIAIAFYVPIISIVATLFAPLPMAWYSAKYDRNSSLLVALIGCITSFFIGGLLIIPFALIYSATGVVIGDALRLKRSKVFLLMSTGITALITFAIEYVIALKLFEIDIIKESMTIMRETYSKSIELSQSLNGQTPLDEQTVNRMFETMETMIPASITIAMFVTTFIIISINLPMLKRFGINVPKFRSFKNMRLPKAVLWYYLIILSINLFISPESGTALYVISLNISLILWLLLTLQGISLIHFILDAYGSPPFLKVLATLMAIPLYSFFVLIGILDLGFDIRSIVKGKIQK
ncbi:YybS family protein [Ureibacillus sp. GCM10028918]|uniref:YybS family protein n=1 Tax=Ureibacillus sp. GCM10028918 TaxID=3273429 RepID=UPI00360CF435